MAKPIKRVRTARGIRYMRGGRFVSNASAKRSMAAKRRRTSTNPMPKAAAKRLAKKQRAGKLAGQVARKKKISKSAKRSAAAKKAWKTRRANMKKKTTTTSKTTRRKKVAKMTKAKRSAAAKKAWRTRRAKAAARSKAAKKAAVSRKRGTKKSTAPKRRRKKPGRKRKIIGTISLPKLRKGRKTKKKVKHYIRKGKRRYTVGRKKNPMAAMKAALKNGLAMWAGLTGMQVINNALRQHVTNRFAASIPAQIAPMLPSLAGFLLSTVVVPKVTRKKAFVDALQMGATVAMLNAAFNTFVKPSLPATMAPYFAGYGEFVAYEPVAGLDEYVDYDNRLGDYVPDNRYGQFQVTEALAMEEVDYMQRGGAGGVFAKTSLGRG